MLICFIHWLRRFTQVVEVAKLMRNAWQDMCYCIADRMLPIANHPGDRDCQLLADICYLLQERNEVMLRGPQETACHQYLPRNAITQDPENLVPDIWLQPIKSKNDAPLGNEALVQPGPITQVQGN